ETRTTVWVAHRSMLRRYGLAVLAVAIALGVGLILASYKVEGVGFPVFLLAIALTVWYAGTWPAIFALLLATLAFNSTVHRSLRRIGQAPRRLSSCYRSFYVGDWQEVSPQS